MSLNSPIPREPAGPGAVPEPEPAPLPASAQPSPDGGAARDLSGLAWLAPSLRSALEDAAAELGHYVDEVRQAPEALGARDTTSLRLAGQHLHQAAGAVHIVGLRGTDPYCQALRRLLDAIDAGTVAAGPEALAVFRAGVQALAEYVDDLMAGDDEAPLRLFQPYAAVLARLGEERVHPADLWLDELQMLPGMLLPAQGPAPVTRARQQFESALLKALRLPTPCADAALLREAWLPLHAALEALRANEQEARRAADHPDRGVWHVLGLVCRALGLGLLPSDLLAKRFAGRANLLLRQYQQGHVRVPQALLNDAVFLLVCTGLAEGANDDAAALRADIARTLAAFRLDAAHAQAKADFRLRYYGWLDPIDTRNLQQAAAGLERAAAADQAAWEIALAALAEAAQPLAQPGLQRCLAQAAMPGRARDAGDALGAAGIALFLSRALALPWRVHGQSAHPAAAHFAAQCDALAACLADRAAAAPAWLARMVDEARAQAQRSEAVAQLRAQLDSGESWLDSYDRNAARPDGAAHLRDARQAFAALAGTLAQLQASPALPGALAGEAVQAGAAVEAVKARLADEGELADAGARAALLRTVAAELGVVHAFADALEFGRARHAEALPEAAAAGDAHAPQDPLDAARAAADEALRAGAVADAPAVQRLRAALQALADQAAIDDDAALRRQAADAVTQCNAWLAGSDDAGARMVMALAAIPAEPAPVPAGATTPSTPSMPAAGDHAAIDAELLDIFLNEADEVLGGIAGDLGAGVEALRDADMLSRLRRAFHTLKGSSRMVGLHRYGEAAWAVEQVMNLWLAEAREPAPALLGLLRRAHAELSAWVARLHGDAAAWHDIAPLVAAAEAVRDAGTAADMAQAAPDVVGDAASNEHPDPAATAADTDAPADTGTPDDNVIPFRLAGGLSDEDDHYKVIGPVRIGLALYNVYLQEADGLLRQFATDISEWRHEAHPCPSELALRVAHTLQGSASTVGLEPVREIAEALEALLLQLGSHPVAMHAGDFRLLEQAAERMRGMLHQFAAGIWPQADAALRRSLVEFGERALLRPRVALPAPPPAETDDAMAQVFGRLPPAAQSAPDVPPADEAGAAPAAPPVTANDAVVIALPTAPRAPEAPAADAGIAPDPALVQIFLEEAQGSLPELGKLLRGWEAAPDDARHGGLVLRALHTLKGSARMAGAMALGQAAHEMETLLDGTLRAQGQQPVAPKVFERLYAWYDRILAHAEALQAGRLLPADDADVVNGLADPEQAADAAVPEPEDAEAPGASPAEAPLPELPVVPGPSDVMVPMPQAAPLAPLAPLAPAEPQRALVRVQARALDTLINEAGEVGATRARLDSELESMRAYLGELNDNVARLRGQLREIEIQAESQMASRIADAQHKQEFDPLEFDRFTRFQELTRMMAESVNDVATVEQNLQRGFDRAAGDLAAQARLTRGLQRGLMQARMVQFDALAERLYRVARQAAAETGKEVRLLIKGGTVEIDRSVLDRMAGPIEHLIRNAVAHGIEPAAQRRGAGKPVTGALTLEVQQEGNEVVLHFIDDGGGLDLARIRARAVERRLLAPDDDASEARLTEMIFTPGFSTAEAVSELAGRGVGMDVVRAETVALGGRITLASQPGQGTTFTVHLPLTTAITQVLVFALGARRYAVPSGMIDQVQQLRGPALLDAYNHGRATVAGAEVPFFYFGALLEQGEAAPAGRKYSPVVVVRSGAERVAVHVDDVVGNREVVVKHIGPHLARLEGIAGATTLGDGEIVLIYNPVVLAQRFVRERGRSLPLDLPLPSSQQRQAVSAPPGAVAELAGDGTAEPVPGLAAQPTVMVVDDSLTVRKATQRLLGRAGYHVVLARDGVDALKQLQDVMPDAMLVDIEMPHMDGFDLTRNVRSDARTAHLPLVMITSRTADKHRRYAEEIGVNVYLGKPYNEDELLGTLHRLLGERAAGTAGSVAQMLGDGQGG
ncbi:Hpt domain-containing protein [Cupriavidus sp. WGlv3]|uniref:hybrid sensor histidine kinase/response regulator n=1 Tax=Cupriavidus sp. WGlv3 TaxID=2919924 RepID=UPI002090DB73|nr:Hpt domain-containing protein [Cupriavidus sp. WGlv3]MCO4860547.1 Hpt domain-containing protein [Cupriavidus sp. WGlv3]